MVRRSSYRYGRDTAGNQRFKETIKPYYKGAMVSSVPHKDTILDSCPAMYHIIIMMIYLKMCASIRLCERLHRNGT